jgi:hypothetical protein
MYESTHSEVKRKMIKTGARNAAPKSPSRVGKKNLVGRRNFDRERILHPAIFLIRARFI